MTPPEPARFRTPRRTFDAALLAPAPPDRSGPPAPSAAEFLQEAEHAAASLLAHAGNSGSVEAADPAGELHRFLDLAAVCGPFVTAAPRFADRIEAELARHLPEGADVRAAAGYPDSPAAREMRSLYRMTWEVSKDRAARELVLELSARRTAERLRTDLPAVWDRLERHLEEYGWVRTWNTALEPLGAKEMVQRMQNALLRWDTTTAGVAAGELEPVVRAGSGPALPEEAGPLADAFRRIAGGIAFTPALFAAARWAGRPFWDRLAEAAGCPAELLPYATPGEILAALSAGGGLDSDQLRARRSNGFTLAVTESGVEARANDVPAPPEGELAGQSVSLGRAVGRVKVVLNADEGGKLLPGDVLVTDLSTPTYEGQPSVFPYRGIPSVAVEKAAAIVTDEGGLLSHAAIVCREHHVPSVLGTEGATALLRDGMIVEVDATRAAGTVTVLEG